MGTGGGVLSGIEPVPLLSHLVKDLKSFNETVGKGDVEQRKEITEFGQQAGLLIV